MDLIVEFGEWLDDEGQREAIRAVRNALGDHGFMVTDVRMNPA